MQGQAALPWEALFLTQVSEASIAGGQPGQPFLGEPWQATGRSEGSPFRSYCGAMITPDHIQN